MAFLMDEKERGKRGFVAVQVGLFANILLAILKTGVGILGNSSALLADGINSVSDVAYYLVVSIFIRLADKPPDDEHPYGHSQLESISAIVVGSFVITTAIAIFFNSVNKLYELVVLGKGDLGAAKYTLWIALFTILLKLLLMLYTNKVGKETNNPAVVALAYDHRNDLFAAIGVSVGIFLSQLGYYLFDPLAGALISFVVLRTGIQIIKESASDLMDAVPGDALRKQVEALLNTIPEIEQIDEIRAHRFGPYIALNITICINGDLTVAEGDRIATQVEELILQNIDFAKTVHVHYHPTSLHNMF